MEESQDVKHFLDDDGGAKCTSHVDDMVAPQEDDQIGKRPGPNQDAKNAAEAEQSMTLRHAVKLYPKAIGWSVLLSTALIMEGYDLALLGALYASPEFNKKYGAPVPGSDGKWEVPAPWQSALSNGARCGEVLGLLINGVVSERYGYRKTMVGALISMIAFISLGLIGTVGSWFLMSAFGRRTLYFSGASILVVILIITGSLSFSPPSNNSAKWAIGVMLMIFTFFYDFTIGPVSYSLVAEMSSTRLKAKTIVLARCGYNISNIVINVLTNYQLNSTAWDWGPRSAYFWAGTGLVCAIWIYFRLPEPKGRTYGELDLLFEHGVSARKFKETKVDPFTQTIGFEGLK